MSKILTLNPKRSLYRGDALTVLSSLPDRCVDAVITDPPYSSGGASSAARMGTPQNKYAQGGKSRHPDFPGDNRDQRGYTHWCALWLSECLRITRPGGVLCIFTDWRQLPVTTDAVQAGGWIWRGIVVWDKTECARPQLGRFRAQCEYVVWASAGKMNSAPNPVVLPGVYRVAVKAKQKHHLTGKPLELMRALVRIVPPRGRILDPFMGSGSTGVAAITEGYHFLGIELFEEYFQVAQERIGQAAAESIEKERKCA